MKKVCMVVPSFSAKGGIASVVSGYRGSALEKAYDIRYIETYSDVSKAKKLWKAVTSYFKFIHLLIFWKPDMVHIHSSFGASFYRKLPFIWLSSWFHIPIVNHIHGADFESFWPNNNRKRQLRIQKAYLRCEKVIALSDEWKLNLSKILPPEKIVIVENYSLIHNDNDNKEICSSNVLFLGFLCKRKGCFDIPAVIDMVSKKIPSVKFILAGSGANEDVNKLKELIKKYNVEEKVVFPGWIRGEEKDMQLSSAALFFLPSYNEGMPMAILDAMGFGKPIVSTTVGGISKIVQNDINGYLFQPGDIDGFSQAITLLLSDKKRRLEMGRKSLEIVMNRYSLEEHIKKIGKIYEMVCS